MKSYASRVSADAVATSLVIGYPGISKIGDIPCTSKIIGRVLPLPHQSSPPLQNSRPAATPAMARDNVKAESNKGQKKEEEEEEQGGLEPDEYVVGALLDSALPSNASTHNRVSRENYQGKGRRYLERYSPLGERVFALASALPAD